MKNTAYIFSIVLLVTAGVALAETVNYQDPSDSYDQPSLLDLNTAQQELYDALELLYEYVNGSTSLTIAQINTQAGIVETRKGNIGDNTTMIDQGFKLVDAYESIKGALFVNSATSGGFTRDDKSTTNKALAHAMLKVYQYLIEDAYTTWNLNNNRSALEGSKFLTANYFPGAVTPPADPEAVYSVQINASQPHAWGYPVMFMEEPARRPTGAYLAPGSIATVTVPAALVNKGFQVRVGAHLADLSNKTTVKRIDRISRTYNITSTDTLVANPLGGGIYIEVPYEVEEGLVTVQIKNTVRSPFYSNTSARQTTLAEWQNTERNYPGPWADFETDKIMFNLPRRWIYNYSDPVSLMNTWDDAMDAISDLQGLPRVRPKTVLYCQIDVLMDANVFSPGYPQSNDSYNPTTWVNGDKDHDYLNGPKFCGYHHLHELGHAMYITKFTGELEAAVNLPYVAVHNRKLGVSLDISFGRSMGGEGCATVSRVQAALTWILSDKFRNGEPMDQYDMKYQHRGWGKYVEIAGLFGWEALDDFWNSVAVDYENGIEYSRNADPTDSRILRMSKAAGVDLTPLIHFWGVHPNNASALKSSILNAGLKKSVKIYDQLLIYQTKVPMSLSAFNNHYWAVDAAPIDNDWYDTMRTDWTATLGQASIDRVQEIIDLYFPNGRPAEGIVQPFPYAESFESASLGEWDQRLNDNFDWSLGSSPHHRTDTGPSAPSDGSYYIYLNADSDGGAYKTASVDCTFDLSNARNPELTFDYHMFGQYIDTLAVDVYDGTIWHSSLWSRNGQQHTSPEDPWSTASVNLTQFAGNSAVIIRFRGKTGEWNKSDTALDNIHLKEGPQSLPYFESFEDGLGAWTQSADDDFDWTRLSGGTSTDGTGPSAASHGSYYLYIEPHDDYDGHNKLAAIECSFDLSHVDGAKLSFDYHMYGANIDYLAVDVFVGSTWTSNVWMRTGAQQISSESAWLTATVDLSAYVGNDDVTIRFRAKEGYWHLSDIAIDKIRVVGPPQSLPYAESFEDGWGAWLQSYDDDYDWTRNSGGTDSPAAGPAGASDGEWYLYAEGHHGLGAYKVGAVECSFDFSGVESVEMTFDYHMYGDFIEYLAVDVYDGSLWSSNVWIRMGPQHSSTNDPWSTAVVNLSDFVGNGDVTLRFRTKNSRWNSADPAIDNIIVAQGPQPLPYFESFENGWGEWKQSTDDDYDWTHNSGGTPTTAAGPSGASDGTYYIYSEGHHGLGSYKVGSVECRFDLSGVDNAVMSFDYHMCGIFIDYLALDIYDGSLWTSNVWIRTGWQHATSDTPWSEALVDLSEYVGNNDVTLRFRAKNSLWNAADPAVDRIILEERAPYDYWCLSAFAAAPVGTDETLSGNPDGDKLSNEMEWILATNPMEADSPILDLMMIDPSFVMTYTRRIIEGVDVQATWSPSLTTPDWKTDGLMETVIDAAGDVETVEASVPADTEKKFIRIEVSK